RTLFATHYHELNALADRLPRVRNARVQVQEHEGKVVFLRKLVPGGADHSYGIEVARMAGLPEAVIRRAKSVLRHLEAHNVADEIAPTDEAPSGDGAMPRVKAAAAGAVGPPEPALPALAEVDPALVAVMDRIAGLDPERMTPIEALMALAELKRLAER